MKFKTDEAFQDFKSRTNTYFSKFFSAYTGASLNYVIREHEEVTDELRDKSAELPVDQDLYNTIVFKGMFWKKDNRTVADLLRPLLEGTEQWQTVLMKCKAKDGRGMWKALCNKMEGSASKLNRHNLATTKMNTTKYTGKGKLTLAKYINIHIEAHNTLADIGQPVADATKVKLFFDNAMNSPLSSDIRNLCMQDGIGENWDKARAKLEEAELINNANSPTGDNRRIAAVTTNVKSKKKAGKSTGKVAKKTRPNKRKMSYLKHEWNSFSDANKAEINAQRKAAAAATASTISTVTTSEEDKDEKRTIAMVVTDTLEPSMKKPKIGWGHLTSPVKVAMVATGPKSKTISKVSTSKSVATPKKSTRDQTDEIMALEAKLVDVGQEKDEFGVPLDMFYWDGPNYIVQHSYGSMLDVKYLEPGVMEKRLAVIMARTPNSESPRTDFLITWAKDAPMRAKRQEAFIQERKDVKKFLTFVMLFDMKDSHASFDSCKKAAVKEHKRALADHEERTLLKLWNERVNDRADTIERGILIAIKKDEKFA
jgi:hypothetical protein